MSAAVVADLVPCDQCGAACPRGAEWCSACIEEERALGEECEAIELVLTELRTANVAGLGPVLSTVPANWGDIHGPLRVFQAAAVALGAEVADTARLMIATPPSNIGPLARHAALRASLLARVTDVLELCTREHGA